MPLDLHESDFTRQGAFRRLALLDRDGTLIEDSGFLHDPAGVVWLPGVVEGLRRLRDAGFAFAAVTNQSGIGRGMYGIRDMSAVNAVLSAELSEAGLVLSRFYYCPHAPGEGCSCRKPKPELALSAMRDFGTDAADVVMIGDKRCDMELACRVGVRGIWLRSPGGDETQPGEGIWCAESFAQAAERILGF